MLDDVVGLILAQRTPSVGSGSGGEFENGSEASTVVRSISVLIGLAVIWMIGCWISKEATARLHGSRRGKDGKKTLTGRYLRWKHLPLLIHTGVLVGPVAGASYAGTSILFAAYLAGVSVRWWDESHRRHSTIPCGETPVLYRSLTKST